MHEWHIGSIHPGDKQKDCKLLLGWNLQGK